MDIYIIQQYTDTNLVKQTFFLNKETAEDELQIANRDLQEQLNYCNSPNNRTDTRRFIDNYEKWNYFHKFKYSLKWYEVPVTMYKIKKDWVNED